MQDVQRRIVCRQGEARKNSLLSAQFIYQCNIALKKKKKVSEGSSDTEQEQLYKYCRNKKSGPWNHFS